MANDYGLLADPWLNMGIGLLARSINQPRPVNTGEALLGGLGQFSRSIEMKQQAQKMAAEEEDRKQRAAMQAMQMQQLQEQMAEKQRINEFYRNMPSFIESPAQQALAQGGGPTIENAAKIPGMSPRINSMALYDRMFQSRIPALMKEGMEGVQVAQKAMAPKIEKSGDDIVQIGPDGVKVLYKGAAKSERQPTSYQEWVLAGSPGTFDSWLLRNKKAGAASVTNVMPGAKDIKDIPKFRKDVQDTVKPQLDTIYALDKALSAIDLSIKTSNPSAFQIARTQLAKAAGDSQISLREIEAAGGDPSLIGQVMDTTSKLFTSTPTVETQLNMKRTMEALRKVAKQKGKAEIDVQRALGQEAKFTDEQLGKALKFDQFEDKAIQPGATVKLKSGKTVQRLD